MTALVSGSVGLRICRFEDLSSYLGPPNAPRLEIASTCRRACRRTMHLSKTHFVLWVSSASPAATCGHLTQQIGIFKMRETERPVEVGGEQINWRLAATTVQTLDGLNRPCIRDEDCPGRLLRLVLGKVIDDRRIVRKVASLEIRNPFRRNSDVAQTKIMTTKR